MSKSKTVISNMNSTQREKGEMMPDFERMKEDWRGGRYVPRSMVSQFSGGILHPKTMANLDSLGQGPTRVKYGKRVFYPVDKLAEWAERRAAQFS